MTTRIKYFYDVLCPSSWQNLLRLQELPSTSFSIDYQPVVNKRMKLLNLQREAGKRFVPINPEQFFAELYCKDAPTISAEHWQVHEQLLEELNQTPHMFLQAVKLYFSDRYVDAIDHLNRRIWEQRLPVSRGYHLFQTATAMGFEFRQSDFLVTQLCHHVVNEALGKGIVDAIEHGAVRAPFFVLSNGNGTEKRCSEKLDELIQ
ncbi:unnamed protein product, partial [Mesorhabditis spiculigera]